MNVSIQDGFNLGWKLAAVLEKRAPASLLSTYAAERSVVAQNLIDFDKEWAEMLARPADAWDDPAELEKYYLAALEFPAGFMTQYDLRDPDGHRIELFTTHYQFIDLEEEPMRWEISDARRSQLWGMPATRRWFFEASEFPDEAVREPLLAAAPATLEDVLGIH